MDKIVKSSAGEICCYYKPRCISQQNSRFIGLFTYSPYQRAAKNRVRSICNTIIASEDIAGTLGTYPRSLSAN